MNEFLVIATVMAAIAAAAVVWPLLRAQRRIQGGVAALLIFGASAVLYPLWSNWNWHAPLAPAAGPDVGAMVAKLEQQLHDEPNDIAGWLMLGRSYLAIERIDDAIVAYDHGHRLDLKNVEAMVGLGEAMSMRSGGQITAPAAQLFEDALVLAPDNPRTLLYAGFAAAVRGDASLARSRWQTLKALHPPPELERLLDARIAELSTAPATSGAPATSAAPTASAGAPAEVRFNIRIAPNLQDRLKSETTLFVFAREPGGRGPPLAAKRLSTAAIGSQITLSSADSMLPSRVLVRGQRVSVTARVSFSGQPTPIAGDLFGELSYDVGVDGVLDLLIDQVAQ